jgi:hypothetical protein
MESAWEALTLFLIAMLVGFVAVFDISFYANLF